ncbi:hypothetical protein GO491_02100 [Flavobacteriaceae bacterium Ap0902]|nr:hypothetical protein [Flavobacteriaceae bacterium Ap0902]
MSKEIYYHTGLSKTGSTFLQNRFFPKVRDAYYLPTRKYRNALNIIPKIDRQKIIVAREFDQQFQEQIIKFSSQYPHAKPIVVFREPGSWALSNYKRFVKNGHPITFKQFIDIEKDQGIFKIKDFRYSRYITLLENNFNEKPLVLLYEDLKSNPEKFLKSLTDYMGSPLDLTQINLLPKHVSYDEKSLKLVRKLSAYIPFQKKLEIHRQPLGYLYNLYANIVRYIILYGAKPLPASWFSKEVFADPKEVEAVSNRFKNEWEFIKQKAAEIH